MILKIRDIHTVARDVVIDDGNLVFARLITGGEEARAIAYFANHKGGHADAHPHVGWVRIQAGVTQVIVRPVFAQGIAQKIVTLYLPLLDERRYFIARREEVERQFPRFLRACTPYPVPRRLPSPERWGTKLDTYDSLDLVALAFSEPDIQGLLKEASRAN
jgi:hypothetical protein